MSPRKHERDPGKEDFQRPERPEGQDEGDQDGEGSDDDDESENEEEIEIPPDPIHEETMARLREEHDFLVRQSEQEAELLRQEIALRDRALRDVQRMEERRRELLLQREQREQLNRFPPGNDGDGPGSGDNAKKSEN